MSLPTDLMLCENRAVTHGDGGVYLLWEFDSMAGCYDKQPKELVVKYRRVDFTDSPDAAAFWLNGDGEVLE